MNATPIKVLVIDDEPPIRKLLRMGLSTQGYDILEASNGKIALEKLAEDPALIVPCIASTKPREIARPRPVPGRTWSPFCAR